MKEVMAHIVALHQIASDLSSEAIKMSPIKEGDKVSVIDGAGVFQRFVYVENMWVKANRNGATLVFRLRQALRCGRRSSLPYYLSVPRKESVRPIAKEYKLDK